MNFNQILKELYTEAIETKGYTHKLKPKTLENIQTIAQVPFNQKGAFTLLVTLSIYKIFLPKQDIRKYQTQIKDVFLGQSMDAKYITLALKRLGLPSMVESGWVTHSLEQPYPYNLDYEGKITHKVVRKAFLVLVTDIEVNKVNPQYILVELFTLIIEMQKENKLTINS